jgi:hypothetical protein
MSRTVGVGAFLGAFALSVSMAAADSAPPVDYVGLFRTKVLPCVHPTVEADKATIELRKEATTSGDITTARVGAFYAGLIKKNSMEVDIMIRQSGSIRQLKINVLSDTSAVHGSCDLTKNWADF